MGGVHQNPNHTSASHRNAGCEKQYLLKNKIVIPKHITVPEFLRTGKDNTTLPRIQTVHSLFSVNLFWYAAVKNFNSKQ